MRNPSTGENEFVILRPYVPFSTDDGRTELMRTSRRRAIPFCTVVHDLPRRSRTAAGRTVPSRNSGQSEQLISREITLQDNEESGTDVLFGDMQIVPVAMALCTFDRSTWQSMASPIPICHRVEREPATFAATMSEALADPSLPTSTFQSAQTLRRRR